MNTRCNAIPLNAHFGKHDSSEIVGVVAAAAAVETGSCSAAHGSMGRTMYPRLTSSLRQAVLLPSTS